MLFRSVVMATVSAALCAASAAFSDAVRTSIAVLVASSLSARLLIHVSDVLVGVTAGADDVVSANAIAIEEGKISTAAVRVPTSIVEGLFIIEEGEKEIARNVHSLRSRL